MGTLGRDMAFWGFVMFAGISLVWKNVLPFVIATALAFIFFGHFFWEKPRAIRESAGRNLHSVILIPLHPLVARLYLFLGGYRITGKWEYAYEIHVAGTANAVNQLARDLEMIITTFSRPAIYFWETCIPVPAPVRQLIRDKIKTGEACWTKNVYPVPKPFTLGFSQKEKKHVRRGVILLN